MSWKFKHTCKCEFYELKYYNILHLSPELFVQNPIPKLDNLCLCDSLCHNHLDLIICLYKPFTNFHVVYIETPTNPITLCPNFLVIFLMQLSQQFHNRIKCHQRPLMERANTTTFDNCTTNIIVSANKKFTGNYHSCNNI